MGFERRHKDVRGGNRPHGNANEPNATSRGIRGESEGRARIGEDWAGFGRKRGERQGSWAVRVKRKRKRYFCPVQTFKAGGNGNQRCLMVLMAADKSRKLQNLCPPPRVAASRAAGRSLSSLCIGDYTHYTFYGKTIL